MKKLFLHILAMTLIVQASGQPFTCGFERMAPPAGLSGKPFVNENQVWPRIYPTTVMDALRVVHESYDRGYLIMGNDADNQYYKNYPFVMKTDVNGDILWKKWISFLGSQAPVYPQVYSFGIGLNSCSDGGFLVTGSTYAVEQCAWDPFCLDGFVMKVNACGEKEWCTIIHNEYSIDYATDAIEAGNGDVWVLMYFGNMDHNDKRVWVYCLDAGGNLKWKRAYLQHPVRKTADETAWKLVPSPPDNILISAEGGLRDTLNPLVAWSWQPIMVMADSAGEEVWGRPLSYEYLTEVYTTNGTICQDANGNFWTGGCVRNYNGIPLTSFPSGLFQMHKGGYPMAYHLFYDNTLPGSASGFQTLVNAGDHTFFALDSWDDGGLGYHNAMLIDTTGVVLKNKHLEMPVWPDGTFWSSIKTSDHKFISVGWNWTNNTNKYDMLIDKLTPGLEHDTLDLRQLVYDSLCPYPIRSDTLKLDCGIIVGMDEIMTSPETRKPRVFPNPATTVVTIELPYAWVTETQTAWGTLVQANYIWPADMVVHIYDISGRLVKSVGWPRGAASLQVDVSHLQAGIHVVRLLSQRRPLADGKLVIIR